MSSDPPDFAAARDHVLREVVRFARRLRRAGADVPVTAALPATRALVEVGLADRDDVRAALHASLVTSPRDSGVFDEVFPEFWYRLRTGLEATATVDDAAEDGRGGRDGGTDVKGELPDPPAEAGVDETAGDGESADIDGTVQSRYVTDGEADPSDTLEDERSGTYSTVGDPSPVAEEVAAGERLDRGAVKRLEAALATLSGRRWSRAAGGDAVDARRALRESLATGGVTIRVPTRERDLSAFRTCVLVDVSQSVLDTIDRGFLLAVLDALVDDGRSARVFFFDTEIREVTGVFADKRGDPSAALERSEITWGGGTQIGASLRTLRQRWPHAVDRRTATLVISDGLDVGEVEELERGMAWLARHAGVVVWLNPLAVSPRYEPTCRGMAAALPYVDGLFAFGGNEDVAEVARQLRRHGPHGPVGYEFDFRDRRGRADERGVDRGGVAT